MCASFVLYADPIIIGMNEDISDRPIKISLRGVFSFADNTIRRAGGQRETTNLVLDKRGVLLSTLDGQAVGDCPGA